MQTKFYSEAVCNRQMNARYWGIWIEREYPKINVNKSVTMQKEGIEKIFIGMCGLENISWENRNAEISIILNPECHGKGYGNQAVELLLEQGFNYLNLENIYAECYMCNPAVKFWEKIAQKYNAKCCYLPNRKYWNGVYYDSFYFNINKSDYKERNI